MQIRSTHFSVGLLGSHKCEDAELRERSHYCSFGSHEIAGVSGMIAHKAAYDVEFSIRKVATVAGWGHFPMQKVEKMRFRMSSEVVWPVRESSAQRAR
jgi:hypothetical protein